MCKVGVIEIGSSSIRLLLTEIKEGGYFKIVDELNSSIELCNDLVDDYILCDSTVNSIISTIKSFKSLCDISEAKEVFVVATEVFRECKNRTFLLEEIKKQTDINVQVLSLQEEINYIYLAVIRSIYVHNSLIVEISGTTTNFAWIKDGSIKEFATIPLGNSNLSYKYNLYDRISKDDFESLITYINLEISNINWLTNNTFDSIIGVGKSIRSLGKIDRMRKKYPIDISHNYKLEKIEINEILNLLKCKNLKQRVDFTPLDESSCETIVGGISIFNSVLKQCEFKDIFISGRGLREGIIYNYIKENFKPIEDILDYSINGILDTLNSNKDHANQVYWITLKLFEGLKPLHKLSSEYGNVIKTASLLHDSGISVNYYSHHKHSFYVILYSYINGLSHRELFMSAAIAASHRFNSYHLPFPQYSSVISKLDLLTIEKIGVLLKIAEGLDRGLVSAVKEVLITFDDEKVVLELQGDHNLDFEIHQALRASSKFREIYKRRLVIKKI